MAQMSRKFLVRLKALVTSSWFDILMIGISAIALTVSIASYRNAKLLHRQESALLDSLASHGEIVSRTEREVPHVDSILSSRSLSSRVSPIQKLPTIVQKIPTNMKGIGIARTITEPFSAAKKAQEEGRYVEAANIYQALIQAFPDVASLYINLGFVNFKLGRLYSAVQAWSKALMIDSCNITASTNLAKAYISMGHYDDAQEMLFLAQRIIENDNTDQSADVKASIYYLLGSVYIARGQKDSALIYYRRLQLTDSSSFYLHLRPFGNIPPH